MRSRVYLRRVLYGGLLTFLIYFVVFRRRSVRVLLTEPHIRQFRQLGTANRTSSRRIPRIVHQTWKTGQVPERWTATVLSVRELNAAQLEYRLWTDESMHEFIRREEPHFYQHTFLKYPLDIQRVDAFRYVLLYHLGGIYIDMDNGCLQSFESLLGTLEALDSNSSHLAAFPRTSPIGISNGFMISTKGHPLFRILVSRLSLFNHNYLIDYLTVMMSAGPLYLSVNEFYFDTSAHAAAVRIIDEIVYSGLYTWHTPGNSWHGRDARAILYVYHGVRKHYSWLILIVSLLIVLFLCRRRLSYRKRTPNVN